MDESIRRKRRTAWLIALGMTGALYALVFWKLNIRFAMNDDSFIMRALMGYETGVPARYHIYMHGLLVRPLGFLYAVWPQLPWYTFCLMALTFLSLAVIVKSLLQCFLRYEKPVWAGAVLSAAFLTAFGMEYAAQVTFTYTSTLLGAAAAAQLFSIDYQRASDRQIISGTLGAAGLAALCYAVRIDAPLPAIAYCGLAFVFLVWEHFGFGKARKRSLRPMILSLCLIAAVLGSMLGLRLLENAAYGSETYRNWHNERSELLDYRGTGGVTQDMLEEAGWDEHTLKLVNNWCFLDESVSAETVSIINDALEAEDTRSFTDHLRAAKRLILSRLEKSAYAFRLMFAGVIAGAAALLGALLMPGRRIRRVFVLLGTAGGFGVMLIYLALEGRLPLRAVSAIAIPAVVMAFSLLPVCTADRRLSRICLCALTVLLFLHSVWYVQPVYRLLLRSENTSQPGQAYADLETWAAQHPQDLFIADGAFSGEDVRAFPQYENGVPHNLTRCAGWSMRSPENEAFFRRFGVDVWSFDPETFLREDVFFAVPDASEPPAFLIEWLAARTGKAIGWETVTQTGRVTILHFTEI